MLTAREAGFAVDTIVVLHFGFVLFVLLGGVFVLKWPRLIWLHLPALAWGILVEFSGWICPLTPLENTLRARAGLAMYHGDFVMHYIMPVLYPENLTRATQVIFGLIVIGINLAIYFYILRIKRSRAKNR